MFSSVSTRKTGSGWLDRIRKAKGFPEDRSTDDLDNFLQKPPATSPQPESSTRRPPISEPMSRNQDNHQQQQQQKLFNVLHELFNFGDTGTNSANLKKSARKQANPRACAFVDNTNVVSEVLRSADGNAGVERVTEVEEGDDGRDWDLPGFSKTEVTVIDTSYECWKFDKLLFRKKNVWKVRDKRNGNVGRSIMKNKKRKGKVEDDDDEYANKKPKLDGKRSDKSEVYKKGPDNVRKVLKKKQPDSKMENGSSSVVLIKSVPTSKKNGTNISKS